MLALFDAAQIGLGCRAVLEMQAERCLIKCQAAVEIGHAEHDVARAHDVERAD